MNIHEMAQKLNLTVVHQERDREVEGVYCCDLLSVALAHAQEKSAWVTVIGNANAVAVAHLTDVACIVLADGYSYDEAAISAASGKVTLYQCKEPIFDTALKIKNLL